MNTQSKTKIRGFVAVIVMLVAVSGVLAFGYVRSNQTTASYQLQLENTYQRSMYELISDINSIENNLAKAVVSTGVESKQQIFSNIYKDCTQASEDLSRLPINHASVDQTTNFINQMGGFSYYVENKLKNGEDLSQTDTNSISELYTTCKYIQTILNDFQNTYSGNYSILASADSYGNMDSSFNSMFSSMQSQDTNFPTLIYDGPFSESQTKKQIKGLSENKVTQDEALKKVQSVYENSVITYDGETTGLFETFNYKVSLENKDLYVQVAKRDGFILSISSYCQSQQDTLSLTECEQKAEEFAQKLGLDLKAVWSTKVTNMAYVNLTPIKNDVVIYADMIKVKISCSSGEIVGWEAQSYAYNHVERTNLTPQISENIARSKVSSSLNITSQRLALIPVEYGKEVLTYEYTCSANDSTYYVYINAKTGEEQKILKVIKTTTGNLLK